jgi:hypothetical protein
MAGASEVVIGFLDVEDSVVFEVAWRRVILMWGNER